MKIIAYQLLSMIIIGILVMIPIGLIYIQDKKWKNTRNQKIRQEIKDFKKK